LTQVPALCWAVESTLNLSLLVAFVYQLLMGGSVVVWCWGHLIGVWQAACRLSWILLHCKKSRCCRCVKLHSPGHWEGFVGLRMAYVCVAGEAMLCVQLHQQLHWSQEEVELLACLCRASAHMQPEYSADLLETLGDFTHWLNLICTMCIALTHLTSQAICLLQLAWLYWQQKWNIGKNMFLTLFQKNSRQALMGVWLSYKKIVFIIGIDRNQKHYSHTCERRRHQHCQHHTQGGCWEL